MNPSYSLCPLPAGTPAEPIARNWLARQLHCPQLPLHRDLRGRPRLAAPLAHIDINWSHSGGQLLIALGKGLHIGCDLEYLRPRRNALAVARRFFHPEEARQLEQLTDPNHLQNHFLHLWCGKEAILKAHGHGLSFGLEKLHLALTANGLDLVECDPALGSPEDWQLQCLPVPEGYIGVLAWRNAENEDRNNLPSRRKTSPEATP